MRGIQSWQGTLFYHMSKQRFFELPGLENPSLKLPATDTMASPWLIDWVVFMVSTTMDIVIIGNKAEEKRSMGMPFSDNPMILFFFLEVHCYFNGYWDVRNDLWEQKWRFGISVPEINLFFFSFSERRNVGFVVIACAANGRHQPLTIGSHHCWRWAGVGGHHCWQKNKWSSTMDAYKRGMILESKARWEWWEM